MANGNSKLGSKVGILSTKGGNVSSGKEQTFPVAVGLGVRNPNRLFRLIRLVLQGGNWDYLGWQKIPTAPGPPSSYPSKGARTQWGQDRLPPSQS